jgi:hypothetical protein
MKFGIFIQVILDNKLTFTFHTKVGLYRCAHGHLHLPKTGRTLSLLRQYGGLEGRTTEPAFR